MPDTLMVLFDAYQKLDDTRLAIEQRIMALPDNVNQEAQWVEMVSVLAQLADVIRQFSTTPANGIAELRAKAHVLTMVQDYSDADNVIALALSLAADVANLPDG